MGDGKNLDTIVCLTEDDEEGESAKEVTPRSVEVWRPLAWRLFDPLDGRVQRCHERLRGLGVPSFVPLSRRTGFPDRLRVEPRWLARHLLAENAAARLRPRDRRDRS